jgi:hypothetical protein
LRSEALLQQFIHYLFDFPLLEVGVPNQVFTSFASDITREAATRPQKVQSLVHALVLNDLDMIPEDEVLNPLAEEDAL